MQMHAFFRILKDDHPILPDNISETLKQFLLKCFIKDPKKRPRAEELLNDPWLKSRRNSIKQISVITEKVRMYTSDIGYKKF